MDTIDSKLLTSSAYKLFIEEIGKHLEAARHLVPKQDNLSADERKRLGGAFHTIRGGAGFFGLKEISTAAHQLEDFFLINETALPLDWNKVQELLSKLAELADKLPKPKA